MRSWTVVLLGACLSTAIAGAQSVARPQYQSAVDLVALNVTVTDRNGFVRDLQASDFLILEDGVPQEVAFFAAERAPLDLAILLDTSASMVEVLGTAQTAAIGFAKSIQPVDRIAVIEVHDRADVLHALSTDLPAAIAAIRRTKARGTTALYNAIYLALSDMTKKRPTLQEVRRQAIAVLSDGEDTRSLLHFDDVLEVAKDAGISIYAIALRLPFEVPTSAFSTRRHTVDPQYALRTFARETGGRYFSVALASELGKVYGTIAEELDNQYVLGYIPKNTRRDGAFRRVAVRIVSQPQAVARTRSGYRAMPSHAGVVAASRARR
jgi:VWFA-related protein